MIYRLATTVNETRPRMNWKAMRGINLRYFVPGSDMWKALISTPRTDPDVDPGGHSSNKGAIADSLHSILDVMN